MLQSVADKHDDHYVRTHSNSIESLVAARNDGKKHLLLAYAIHLDLPFESKTKTLTLASSASGSVATIKSESRPQLD